MFPVKIQSIPGQPQVNLTDKPKMMIELGAFEASIRLDSLFFILITLPWTICVLIITYILRRYAQWRNQDLYSEEPAVRNYTYGDRLGLFHYDNFII